MKRVAVIGAGQLGSRHLQALNLVNEPLEIFVVEPNPAALDVARTRFESTIQSVKHVVTYQNQLNLTGLIDFAIVASTATARRDIVQALLSQTTVRHLILEKLLFTNQQDYADIADTLKSRETKAWVNCTMRMVPFYNQIEKSFSNEPLTYRVDGSQYGLVTNAIHYLDHLAHLTGCVNFSVNTDYLDKQIISSKRPGFYELTGALIAKYDDGSLAFIQSNSVGTSPIQVEIYNSSCRVISRESQNQAWISSVNDDWIWQEKEAPIPFQSTLTADLINELLETDSCRLVDFETSSAIHLQLLEPLKAFLNDQGMMTEVDYPFT